VKEKTRWQLPAGFFDLGINICVRLNFAVMWEFTYYEDSRGNALVENFILAITERKLRTQLLAKLGLIAARPFLAEPHYKRFTNYPVDFGELIVGDFRIFVHRVSKNEYLMVHAFRKKSNATPRKEIDLAFGRILDFISRQNYEKGSR